MLEVIKARYEQQRDGVVRHSHPLRILGCLIILLLHCVILGSESPVSVWIVILAHTLLYPHVTYLFTFTAKDERRNIIIDNAAYGFALALWGLNPLACLVLLSALTMTNFSAGGLPMVISGAISSVFGGSLAIALNGFYFRPELSFTATVILCISLYAYLLSLGGMFYRVNQKLIRIKNSLAQQKETLQDISDLAQKVNAHLDVDEIMRPVLSTLRQMYSFEQVYLLMLSDDRKTVSLTRSYGRYVAPGILDQVVGMEFSTETQASSIFVWPLLKDRNVFVPKAARPDPAIAPPIDIELYELKAPISVAYFPLHVENKVVGGIAIFNYDQPLDLDEEAFQTIAAYLVQVGAAVRNARLLERARLAREEAVAAQHAAEESEKAKSRFLANMSHEIRTPMTAILGYAESLLDENVDFKDRRQFASTIIRSGKHLLTIINDILDISKIEADQLDVETIPVQTAFLLEEVRSHLGLRAHEKGLAFRVVCDFPIPRVFETDPTRLKQILFNLGANAIKFTDHGSVEIRLFYDEARHRLGFAFTDTGIGLTREELERVFDPFVQADSSTTRKYGGTGLGLHISRELARLLGGSLEATSEKGRGSCFTAWIDPGSGIGMKWLESEKDLEVAGEDFVSDGDIVVPQLQGHILLAEDNEDNQDLIRRLLHQAGLEVTVVDNGEAALASIRQSAFDLILLDIQMPGMGGEEVVRRLHGKDVSTPLIAITANVMRHQIENYLQIGFDNFVAKPLNRRSFFNLLTEYLSPRVCSGECRLLIVEDNITNQLLLRRQLQSVADAAEILTASNGREALEIVGNSAPDLVFMDIQMPEMDGMQALKSLRERGFKRPIYMLSGNVAVSDVQASLEAGANGHLCKPVNRDDLRQVLFRHIRQAQTEAE